MIQQPPEYHFRTIPTDESLPDIPMGVPTLKYEAPTLGVNYWVEDNLFTPAQLKVISNRGFNQKKWRMGLPYTAEKWPGMRANKALKADELQHLEQWVKEQTGSSKLWVEQPEGKPRLDSNVIQLIGKSESGPLPHTDSISLCRYAAVIYLSPEPKSNSGTAFYRLRYPNGAAGGNMVTPPANNLRDALNVKNLPPDAWYEDCVVENKFGRVLLYKSNMVHSATGYFGKEKRDKRMTALFFWLAE